MADKKSGTKKSTKGGKGKSASPKKSPKKTVSPAASRGAKPAATGGGSSNTALYVLVIMILATIVILLSGQYIKEVPHLWERARKQMDVKKDTVQEKKNDHKDADKTSKDSIKEPEKTKTGDAVSLDREIEAKIYFVRVNDATEKTFLSPVRRKVRENAKVEEALKLLIRGASGEEKKKGYLSAVPDNLKVNDVKIRNRTAEIDFNSAIEYGATGNILVNRIDQIVYTATQFPDIDNVVIKINGKRQKTLGADGLFIDGPLHRSK